MTKEFAALIFIGLLVLVVLVYAVFSAQERSGAVEARLAAMSGLGGANNRLAKNAQLAAFLRQPECQATILVMMGALLLGWFLKLSIAAEVLLLVMVGAASWIIVRRWRLDRARRAFLSRFPEAVDNFTRSIQAGIPVDRALKILGEAYDDELGRRVLKLCREMKVGLPFREALGNFADELDDPDVDFFCEVLALNRETGSALSPMLASLSMMLRERRAIDRKLKALTSESRASARVLCLLPVFILGLQAFLNPSQLLFLVNDPAGRIVAGCALACMLAGFIIIQRMSRSLNG